MNNVFDFNVVGLKELQDRIKNLPDKLVKRIDAELKYGAEGIAAEAKSNAPGDQGILRQEISAGKLDTLSYYVVSGALYSAYVEFGTRTKVSVPAELADFAAQFIHGGAASSLSAKEAIFEWCRRHGIDRKAWYAIYISIMIKGTRPQPFFFPAFFHQRPIIIKNIQQAITDET